MTDEPLAEPPLRLEARGLEKHFGGVAALRDASLVVRAGEVHALAGANGAGKSTLLRILAGLVHPDAGTVHVEGAPVTIDHPTDATRLGLNFIHQELNLVPKFTVLQNMMLGHPDGGRRGFLDRRSMRRRATEVLDRLQVTLDLDETSDRLRTHEQWMVSLGHALMRDARLLAMDEPTASFTEGEVTHLFEVIRDLTADGCSVIYVSHRLSEILEIADRVTVLRDGRLVDTWRTSELDREQLTVQIVGHEVEEITPPSESARTSAPVLAMSGVACEPRVRSVSLECHAGEILGLAGLVGAGRTEIARVLFGLDRPTAGTMTLDGKPYAPRSSYDAVRSGVALVPEERRAQGLVLEESIEFNIGMAANKADRVGVLPLVSPSRKRRAARDMVDRLGIKTPSTRTQVMSLSGGNQQKVVVAKWLRTGPRLLILDEPTVGVDVGAREDMYGIIEQLAAAGTALILISSDFDELKLCHRVAVVHEGRVTRIVDGGTTSKDELTRLCYEAATP